MREIEYKGLAGKQVAVFGLGKSGLAAAEMLLDMGANVYAWDDNPDSCRKFAAEMVNKRGVTISPPDSYMWGGISTLVLSPGVPFTHPAPHKVVSMAREVRAEIICDIELLFRAAPKAKYVGITGTNGKSTTTALIGHILKESEKNVEVGGNIGRAACTLPLLGEDGIYVLELSSYQLELLNTSRMDISVLLNVTPDHIDRHGNMQGYIAAKMHIFDRSKKGDVAVIGMDSLDSPAIIEDLSAYYKGRIIPISGYNRLASGVFADEESITSKLRGNKIIKLAELAQLPGRHNRQNIAAAYTTCRALKVKSEAIIKAIRTYKALDHRLQDVGTWRGVRFVNDSKATNGMASSHALAAFPEIFWIAGGIAKEDGLEPVMPYINHVKKAYLIGKAEDEFANALTGKVHYEKCGTLETAFAKASEDSLALASGGGKPVVLLSPACASFDQFQNFEHRGRVFAELFLTMLKKQEKAA